MNFTDREKELLLENAAVLSRLTLYDEDNSVLQVFTDDDYIVDWDYEDYRYVPDQGFIGQFVERLLDGHFINIPDDISLENKEIEMEIAVKDPELEEQVYHSYGRFIITKIEKEDASGSYKFEASDYTKKFNVAYESSVNYPCLAIELLNDAANKAEVYLEGNDTCLAYAVTENGLSAGNYCFAAYVDDTLTYFNFTTEKDLSYRDSLMLVASKGKVIQRVVNEDYSVTETEIVYASSTTQVGTLLSNEELSYVDFINNNFVIEDNQFVENNSCREVVSAIAKLGYTWARINENNKLCLDFVKNDNVDSYDEIDTDKYYEATVTGDKVEPINKVLIGMSQVEGENIVKEQDGDLLGVDTIYGETSQDTYSGKNLLNLTTNTTLSGVTVVADYEVATINGTFTSDGKIDIGTSNLPAGTYTMMVEYLSGTISNPIYISGWCYEIGTWNRPVETSLGVSQSVKRASATFTLTSTKNICFGLYLTNGRSFNNVKIRVSIVKGSTADFNFEKYVGGTPSPNLDFPQDVKTVRGNNNLKIANKNMLHLLNYIEETKNGVTLSVDDDGTFTLNGTATAQSDFTKWYAIETKANIPYTLNIIYVSGSATGNVGIYNEDGNHSWQGWDLALTGQSNVKVTHTFNYDMNLTTRPLRAYNGVTYNNLKFQVQFTQGATEDYEYEQYQERLQPLNFPVENLFDGELELGNYNNSGYKIYDNTVYRNVNIVPVKPNTTYTLSIDGVSHRYCLYFYNSSKTYISWTSALTTGTFTTPNNCYYINFRCFQADFTSDFANLKVQLEEGNKANSFTPYCTVPFGDNLFNKNDYNMINAWFSDAQTTILSSNDTRTVYISCKPNTTYTISKIPSARFSVGYTNSEPANNVSVSGITGSINGETNIITISTGAEAQYIVIYMYHATHDSGITLSHIIDSIRIEKGGTTHEEYKTLDVCNISDYVGKDQIYRSVGKNILNTSEMESKTLNGITCVYDGNAQTMTFNGTCTTNNTTFGFKCGAVYLDGTYTLSYDVIGGTITNPTNNTRIQFQRGGDWAGIWLPLTQQSNSTTKNQYNYTLMSNNIRFDNGVSVNNYKIRIQLEKGSSKTEFEPYCNEGEWFFKHKTGKMLLDGRTHYGNTYNTLGNGTDGIKRFQVKNTSMIGNVPNDKITTYSNSFKGIAYTGSLSTPNSICQWSADNMFAVTTASTTMTLAEFKTMLINKPIYVYCCLPSTQYEKITYQPLIDQLNELQNTPLFEGINHITIDTLNEQPSLDITVTDLEQDSTSYSGKSFEITGHDYDKGGSIYIYDNPLTYTEELRRIAINGSENLFGLTYIPMEVNSIGHPWLTGKEFVKVTNLENQELYFYPFDRKMSYKGYITTDLSATAENQVKEKYENPNNILNRLTHTEIDVDKANQRIDLIAEQTSGNTQNITNMQLDITGINQSVQHIEDTEIAGLQSQISTVNQTMNTITNMFQISGGINVIRNSAFLLQDAVWEFTNNGTNPYYTPLGSSYNVALSGTTTSVAEIKLRSVKVKSKSENVTNLILGTKYTFNFYHKQDNNMTTTIKMYSTENNNVKAFNDIVITGQQGFRNYEVSFTPTTYANYTIEIIVTSTASVGYAYIYDMMLNSGDKQSWQPASDEIYSTTLQMSRLGLQVYSVGDGTITILGSDGMATYETTDGKTLGRLVSLRNIDGDRTRVITTQAVYLTKDITQENDNKWVETIVTISGSPYKVEYVESGE